MGKLNTFFKVLLGIVLALILVGVTLFLAFYLRTPQGLHVVYDGVKYGNSAVGTSSTGISVVRSNSSEFAIGNSKGWGVYSADDCIVKIIPNVDEAHNFEFTVEGEEKPYLYSAISDLSAAFCEDYGGNGITITPDGTFIISADYIFLSDVLTTFYGVDIVLEDDCVLSDYPYIALSVTPPDGSAPLVFPLLIVGDGGVDDVKLDKDGIVI